MRASPLARLRRVCLALPEAHEVLAWGEPTFRVRNKLFAMYADAANHHGNGRHAVWIKARSADQNLVVSLKPAQYFVPPYVGPSGWIGAGLDANADWPEIGELLRDGYRLVAPKKLLAVFDHAQTPGPRRASPTREPRRRTLLDGNT